MTALMIYIPSCYDFVRHVCSIVRFISAKYQKNDKALITRSERVKRRSEMQLHRAYMNGMKFDVYKHRLTNAKQQYRLDSLYTALLSAAK